MAKFRLEHRNKRGEYSIVQDFDRPLTPIDVAASELMEVAQSSSITITYTDDSAIRYTKES